MGLTTNFGEYIPLIIIVLTVISSIAGFNNSTFFERNKFNVGAILKYKQWDRMLTSAFLHGDFMHLIFNMYVLYNFSDVILIYTGVWQYLAIYFGAILAGNFLALFMHRTYYHYSAIGASGGVMGILFAAIAVIPTAELGFMFIPIGFPAWMFGTVYLLYSIYSMRRGRDNIGHEAHLGGALVGLALITLFVPEMVLPNWKYLAMMLLPIGYLGYEVWKELK